MSNYTIVTTTAWNIRDDLTTGVTGKTISGTEFHAEFDSIATHMATKADTVSPTFTGTPELAAATATTAALNTDTTQIATTQYVMATKVEIMKTVYPVGSIFTTVSDSTALATSAAEVATLMGFGTWLAFGEGTVLVGKEATGTFSTAGATGGSETHQLTVAEMPTHDHATNIRVESSGALVDGTKVTSVASGNVVDHITTNTTTSTDTSDVGSSDAHNNLQPYVVVYMWKRTA